MTRTSCAGYIIYCDMILLVHPTGFSWKLWSAPKGICEPSESEEDAMYREVYEETNIALADYPHKIVDIGRKKYKYKNKMIHGYVIILSDWDYPDIFCSSTFMTDDGIIYPEVDAFMWTPLRSMKNVIADVQYELFDENRNLFERLIK